MRRRVMRTLGSVSNRMMNRAAGVGGRHRPFYFLNLTDRGRTLEDAVAGRIVLVTGASSGIGEAATLRIAAAGGEVVMVARTAEKLEALRERIEADGGTAHCHPCDLSDDAEVERLTAEVLAQHGRVDILVNNAGRSIRRAVSSSTDRFHDYERTMQLNYFGAVRLVLAFLPGMRERGDGQIVNVSTAGVATRVPRFSAYVASKAALDAFSDCLRGEVAHRGITVTNIHMPLVRTPMIAPTPLYRSMPALTPDEAAERVEKAIVYRPPRIGTPYTEFASLADAVSPFSIQALRSAGYRATRESEAARGDDES